MAGMPPDTLTINVTATAPLVLQAVGEDRSLLSQWSFHQSRIVEAPALKFRRLANQWRKETRFISTMKRKILHPAYQQIIGMGEPAIPMILRELDEAPGDWLWALESISTENPVKAEDNFEQAVKAWLHWGHERDYSQR